MSVALFIAVALGWAAVTAGLRGRPPVASIVGLLGLAVVGLIASALDTGASSEVGGATLATGSYLKLFLVLGSVVGLALALVGAATDPGRDAPEATLAILGGAGLALALPDVGSAVIAATAAGLLGVLAVWAADGGRAGATAGIREARLVVVAGAVALTAVALVGRAPEVPVPPTAVAAAYLTFALAVAMRFGAIPFHVRSARLPDAVPEAGLPVLTALGPAILAIVCLGWIATGVGPQTIDLGVERGIVLAVAVASIVLAAVAAFIQDDIEHVLGYAIVADAGVVVLALGTLDPAAAGPARSWILVFIVGRSALAAWVAAIRAALFTRRIADIRGWARRSPLLAIALCLIAVASIGFPGLASFDARASLVDLAAGGVLAVVIKVAALAPILYYARLLAIGIAAPDDIGRAVASSRPRLARLDLTAVGPWVGSMWTGNRAATSAVVAALLGVLTLVIAAGWLGVPAAAASPGGALSHDVGVAP